MATSRITFLADDELVKELDKTKKDHFYDTNRSEMVRALIVTGMQSLDELANKKVKK